MSNETASHPIREIHVLPKGLVWAIRLFLAVVIVLASVWGHRRLLATAPVRQMRPPQERVAMVAVAPLAKSSRQVTVAATGTVVPARQLALAARVPGEVTALHPALDPGGCLAAGEVAVTLDRTDYELAVSRADIQVARARSTLAQTEISRLQAESEKTQAESQLVTAEYNHRLELGQQSVARYQWEMLENKETATELEKELTLRQPHLRKAEADVASARAGVAVAEQKIKTAKTSVEAARAALRDAEAALEQARLDLGRTEVRVPFAAVVLDRTASLGAQVTTQTQLATLVDAEVFWVRVAVPLDRVPWIRVRRDGEPGARVALRPTGSLSGSGEWTGEVVRRLPAIEDLGRQARFLVEVRNPLEPGAFPLLLGAFVQAEIEGPERADVFVVPRSALRDGRQVWLRNAEGRLEVVPVAIEWSDADTVLVRDSLEEGAMLVTSDIASPVPGMKLALPGETHGAAAPNSAAAPRPPKAE